MRFPALDGGKEVWIYFFLTDRGETGYAATLMKKGNARLVAARMRKKHSSQFWRMRYMSFVKAIEGLKQDILDGKYDERLGTDTAKLIFDAHKTSLCDEVRICYLSDGDGGASAPNPHQRLREAHSEHARKLVGQ